MKNPHQVTRDFESALCAYTGARYAVTVTSCTAALMLAVAWHLRDADYPLTSGGRALTGRVIEIPKRTYVGVPYAIREAGGYPAFRDEEWSGAYRLKPLPVWDSARWFTQDLFDAVTGFGDGFVCVSFQWSKTLGIQQGGAILHDSPEADAWLRRARFDGRAEGVPPAQDTFPLRRAWHAYMAPETAAAGLVRLSHLPAINDPLPDDDYPDLSKLEIFK